MRNFIFVLLSFCLACQPKNMTTNAAKLSFYVGTYTRAEGHVDGKGNGIYKLVFDPSTLDVQVSDTIKGMTNPSFLALSKDRSTLYAVNEIGPGSSAIGLLDAYSIGTKDFGKKLHSTSTASYAPCHIELNTNENIAIVCNYVGGTVSVYPLPMKENVQAQIIKLPALPKTNPRQDDSHPHSAVFSADGQMAYIADLGTDRVMIYKVDEAGQKLSPAGKPFFTLPDGSGPRHFALSSDGKILYTLCELSNKVAVLDIKDKDSLVQRQLIGTLPVSFTTPNTSADIHLSKNGQFLYSSNRGHNSIAVFKVLSDGSLESIGHVGTEGRTPRNFHLTNDGNWMLVANQDTDNIALFDLRKGDLPVFVKNIKINTPVSIVEL